MDNSPPPLITIITLCFNSEKDLSDTIASTLSQVGVDFEYIIIDGASSDGSVAIIEEYSKLAQKKGVSFDWVSEKDKGIYDAMNKGVARARGEWINFMNAGDTFVTESTVCNLFSRKEIFAFEVVHGDTIEIPECGDAYVKKSNHNDLLLLNSNNPLCHQSVFMKTNILQHLGFRKYKYSMDLDLWMRAYLQKKTFIHIDMPVSKYKLGGISSSQYHATGVMIEHRIVKMLALERYSVSLIAALLLDILMLSVKLYVRRVLGDSFYYRCKGIFR